MTLWDTHPFAVYFVLVLFVVDSHARSRHPLR
jgi:hypothetical protein